MARIISNLTIALLWFSVAGCDQPSSPEWIHTTQTPQTAPQHMAMPPELLQQNIMTTAYTGVVLPIKVKVTTSNGGKPSAFATDYVNHIYHAKVIETIKGPVLEEITYAVMAEARIAPRLENYPIIVSLCGSAQQGFYIPDNGYESAAPEALIQQARKFAARVASEKLTDEKTAISVCKH